MNRRLFMRHALTGLGLGSLPVSLVRAASEELPTPPTAPAPPQPAPETVMATMGLPIKASVGPLLERARAALDTHADKILLRDRIALADFSAASSQHRFHIVDLAAGHAISYLVAHGLGSDPTHSGYLQTFSNEPNSQATSEGAYLTGELYDGQHGASMRLVGLDPTNNNADIRAIVVHSAPYVSEDHVAVWGKAGRSNGCFVFAPHLITQVLGLIGPGRLLLSAKI
jgi:hypothetical protein